ncbi:MAG TPA: T9SS type A sorting domain-containing protein [Moheibacter sp.]|nr:T9SS type A sorting domain-containing protein [Moheibacter sp.]
MFAQVGTLDETFNVGTGANAEVKTITVQPDGKILMGGGFTQYNGFSQNRLIRLFPDGSVDESFNIGSGPSGIVNQIKVLEDGKILIGGAFSRYNGIQRKFMAKLNPNGSLDNSFNTMDNTNMSSAVEDFLVLPDGKILMVGNITNFNNTGINYLVKLNPDGSLDTSFEQGTGFDYSVLTVDIQSDGKIIVGGNFTSYNGQEVNYFARLLPDGSLDTTFNPDGDGPGDKVTSVKVLDNDKILIGGGFVSYNNQSCPAFIRLNPDGTRDTSFEEAENIVSSARQILVQPNNKILIAGSYTYFNSESPRSLMRLNEDGSKDIEFSEGMGEGPNTILYTCALQNDGKILIGGNFTNYDGTNINRIARINGDFIMNVSDEINHQLQVYPNPTNQYLQISSTRKWEEYAIFSLVGKLMERGKYEENKIISVAHLPKGVYIIRLSGENLLDNRSFIKN